VSVAASPSTLVEAFAHSPAALSAYRGLLCIADEGVLSAPMRRRLAVALAAQLACPHCLSVATAQARDGGLTGNEIMANALGRSQDARAERGIAFALLVFEHRGAVSDDVWVAVRASGYSDAEIAEIVVHVGLATLSGAMARLTRLSARKDTSVPASVQPAPQVRNFAG
jgi:AhpD family alkylhydroperoxidase